MEQTENGKCIELDLYCSPLQRRLWLLAQALAKLPLAEALVLASKAESFLTNGVGEPTLHADAALADAPRQSALVVDASSHGENPDGKAGPPSREAAAPLTPPAGDIDRQTLFARLAQGATNPELAKEFGLTQRQIQGFRMQTARPRSVEAPTAADEIVRFLRREGDVVVGAGENQFIVNGRFRMTLDELTERANRIRARRGKSLFPSVVSAAACAVASLGAMS